MNENSLISISDKNFFNEDNQKIIEKVLIPRRPKGRKPISTFLFELNSEETGNSIFEKCNKKFKEIIFNLEGIASEDLRNSYTAFCNLLKGYSGFFWSKEKGGNKEYAQYLHSALKAFDGFIKVDRYINSIESLNYLIETLSENPELALFCEWLEGVWNLTHMEMNHIKKEIKKGKKFQIEGVVVEHEIAVLSRKIKLIKEVREYNGNEKSVIALENVLENLSVFSETLIKIRVENKPALMEAVIKLLKKLQINSKGQINLIGLTLKYDWFFQWFKLYLDGNNKSSEIFQSGLSTLEDWIQDLEKEIKKKKLENEKGLWDRLEKGKEKKFKFKKPEEEMWLEIGTARDRGHFTWKNHLKNSSSIILILIAVFTFIFTLGLSVALGQSKNSLSLGSLSISGLAFALIIGPLGALFAASLVHRVLFFLEYDDNRTDLKHLEKNHKQLENRYESLQTNYQTLTKEVSEWKKNQERDIDRIIREAHEIFTQEVDSTRPSEEKVNRKKEIYELITLILSLSFPPEPKPKAKKDKDSDMTSSSDDITDHKPDNTQVKKKIFIESDEEKIILKKEEDEDSYEFKV